MPEYQYTVHPGLETFDTRHEAVGFAAVHDREYTYYRMNNIDTNPVPVRIEATKVPQEAGA